MSNLPLLTIVTPSYNQGQFIEETILSVKNQSYRPIEHLVIDGGSADNTLDVLRRYEADITWVSEADEGQSDAINKGWRRAQGEILNFINSDDIFLPQTVQPALEFMAAHPEIDIVYGDSHFIDEHSRLTERYKARPYSLAELLTEGCYIHNQSAFMRRRVFERIGGMHLSRHMTMDYEYWLRAAVAGFTFAYLPYPIGAWRFHSEAKNHSIPLIARYGEERATLLDEAFDTLGGAHPLAPLKARAYSRIHLDLATRYFAVRENALARERFLKVLWQYPRWFSERPETVPIFLKSFASTSLLIPASRVRNRYVRLSRRNA